MSEVGDTSDTSIDDLRLLVAALEELDEKAMASADAGAQEIATQRVALAMELKTVADQCLHDRVEQARADQVPWQQIGDVLGISRQAAFQRFRNPDDPRGDNPMRTKSNNALIPKAEAVYQHLQAGDYEAVGSQMTFVVQRVLNERKVMGVWREAEKMAGSLESLGESFVRPSGRNAVVVETPLSFEAAEFIGRIAYNKRDKIIGMLIMRPEEIASAPF